MTLIELKRYLMQVQVASSTALCAYFKCDADLLRCMLSHWLRKGNVRCVKPSSQCGACTQCGMHQLEWYEWVGGVDSPVSG